MPVTAVPDVFVSVKMEFLLVADEPPIGMLQKP